MTRPVRRFALIVVLALAVTAIGFGRRLMPPPVRLWSAPGGWHGHPPCAGDDVTIPSGTTVLLDQSPPPLGHVQVNGTLIFADKDLSLTCRSVTVRGRLEIGTERRPFHHHVLLTLTGRAGEDGEQKSLSISGGALEIHGLPPGPCWTRLGVTAPTGTARLTLARPVSWRPGQRLVVASTDFDADRAETRTIQSIRGAVVVLNAPLRFTHWGTVTDGVDERAEVGLLSRNIVIQGDTASVRDGYGGQVMIMHGSTAHIADAEFRRLGQAGHLGRYPVHFHLAGNMRGSYVRGCSIHDCFNRFLTLHGTHGVRVEDNLGFNTLGHGFFLEDGTESKNVLTGNLGLLTRIPTPKRAVLTSDMTPATFWIANPDNTLRGNVAAGSDGHGFWYDLPAHPTGADDTPENRRTVQPRRLPMGVFDGNTAHSNALDGLFVDGPPNPPGVTGAPNYVPRHGQGLFAGLTAYKNRRRGFWLRGQGLTVQNAHLADNGIGGTLAAADSQFRDSMVVGQTDNGGLPRPWLPHAPLVGFEFYDGPVTIQNVAFRHFHSNAARPAGALSVLEHDPFFLHPDNRAEGLRFTDAQPVFLPSRFFGGKSAPGDPNAGADGSRTAAFLDVDGSVSGLPGSEIALDTPFLHSPQSVRRPAWNAAVSRAHYAHLFVDNKDAQPTAIAPVRLTRLDSSRPGVNLWGVPKSGPNASFQSTVLTERSYSIRWHGPAPSRLRLTLRCAPNPTDWVIITLPNESGRTIILPAPGLPPFRPASNIKALRASSVTTYCRTGRTLTVKLVAGVKNRQDAVAEVRQRLEHVASGA